MPQKLDGKFHGMIAKNKDGSIVPQDQWIVFLAKDNALPATLKFYYDECERDGCAMEQLEAIADLIVRVENWRSENLEKCKSADVQAGEIIT